MPAQDKPQRSRARRRSQPAPGAAARPQGGAAGGPPDGVRRLSPAEVAAKREQLRRRFH
jgi:hypothetical protein